MKRLERYYGVTPRMKRKTIKTRESANQCNMRAHILSGKMDTANSESYAPLHYASFHGSFKSMWILLCSGANINTCSKFDKTPLHYVVDKELLHGTWILLVCGANASATHPLDQTPIHTTTSPEIRNLLIQN